MKVALCISGKLGEWRIAKQSILDKIIKPFKPDVFISTWDNQDCKEFLNFYKPIKFELLNFKYHENEIFKAGDNRSLGLKPMTYGMLRSFQLIPKDALDYDLVIRLRPDLKIIDSIRKHEAKSPKCIKLPFYESHSIYDHQKEMSRDMSFSFIYEKSILPNQINDRIALGPANLMKKYMNSFKLIDQSINFLINEGYPEYMAEVPESILTTAARLNNIHFARLSGNSNFGNLNTELIK